VGSWLYWYHVPDLQAVKISRTNDDPTDQTSDDEKRHEDYGCNIKIYQFDDVIDIAWAEREVHKRLEQVGCRRIIPIRNATRTNELFALGQKTYDEIDQILHGFCRHIALAYESNRRKEQTRMGQEAEQQDEEARHRAEEAEREWEEEVEANRRRAAEAQRREAERTEAQRRAEVDVKKARRRNELRQQEKEALGRAGMILLITVVGLFMIMFTAEKGCSSSNQTMLDTMPTKQGTDGTPWD
jgi:hypothetical protein